MNTSIWLNSDILKAVDDSLYSEESRSEFFRKAALAEIDRRKKAAPDFDERLLDLERRVTAAGF